MSQIGDNFTNHFEEVSQIPVYVDSQTYTNTLQESSILCSCRVHRQLNEHYQSHNHNDQVPTDQFVMNQPDVAPTSRHLFSGAIINGLNLLRYNANSNRALVPAAESSTANNIRREVVEHEHRLSRRHYPRVIRPTPYKPYDPRYAAIGLPVDPHLRAFKQNPNFPMPKATSDESSTANNIRTDYARSGVPRLHQSSSHSGREVVEQEHRLSRRDNPRVIRPTLYKPYDPRYADIGLPVDPFLRAFKQNPNFGLPKRDE